MSFILPPSSTTDMSHDGFLLTSLRDLLEEADDIYSRYCGLANAAAFLASQVVDINWLGFYLTVPEASGKSARLILGPFAGQPACTRIGWGKGVCGCAAALDQVHRVPDVHDFPGHIACDPASRSELVVPLHGPSGAVVGVLDIDSPLLDRFSFDDEVFFGAAAGIIETKLFS